MSDKPDYKHRWDVIAVSLKTYRVRFMDTGLDAGNASALMRMAVMRRGVDEEFFTTCEHGKFKEGDTYEAGETAPDLIERHGTIQTIGGMSFPIGHRGLD